MQTWPSVWVTPPEKTTCGPERITQVPPVCLVVFPVTVSVPTPVIVPLSTVTIVLTPRLPPPENVIWPPVCVSEVIDRASGTVTLSP